MLMKFNLMAFHPEMWDEPCLTPETEIEFWDGSTHNLREIYENNMVNSRVISHDSKGNKVPGVIDRVYRVSNNSKILYDIELENGKVIHCTKHHKLMLKDGTYKEAQYLTESDELMEV